MKHVRRPWDLGTEGRKMESTDSFPFAGLLRLYLPFRVLTLWEEACARADSKLAISWRAGNTAG